MTSTHTTERLRITGEVTKGVLQRFPMVPQTMVAALAADAGDWLDQAGDVVTPSALLPLVVESLEFRLRLRNRRP